MRVLKLIFFLPCSLISVLILIFTKFHYFVENIRAGKDIAPEIKEFMNKFYYLNIIINILFWILLIKSLIM